MLEVIFTNAEAKSYSLESIRDTTKYISKKRFDYFLKLADTAIKEGKEYHKFVASCTWGTYKIISDKYILRINTNFFSESKNGFYEIDADSLIGEKAMEILVYDKANATLINICTDVGDFYNPRENRTLRVVSGKIILSFTKFTKPYQGYEVVLLIKELKFYDPVTSKWTFITNELPWKIDWEGMPG